LLENGVKRLDCLTVGTPIGSIIVLFAGDEDECASRGLDQLFQHYLELRQSDDLSHCYLQLIL
jgi:hypothetical protein